MNRVMIVTPNQDMRTIIWHYLERMSIDYVLCVTNGEAALRVLGNPESGIDVAIISNERLGMPAENIWKRARKVNPLIKGVVFTTSPNLQKVVDAFGGEVAVVLVPFDFDALRAAVLVQR